MRDAITTLEQLAAFTGGKITLDDVEGLLGEVDSAPLFEIADSSHVATSRLLPLGRPVRRRGHGPAEFVRELTVHVRNLFVSASVDATQGIVDATAEDRAHLLRQAAEFGPDRLSRCMDLLGELAQQARWAATRGSRSRSRSCACARPQGEMTLAALAERVEASRRRERSVRDSPAAPAPRRRRGRRPRRLPRRSGPHRPGARPRGHRGAGRDDDVPSRRAACRRGAAGPRCRARRRAAPREPCDSYSPPPKAAPGSLDRAAAQARLAERVQEVRRKSAPLAHMLANTVADVDGDELVVEFPADESIMAELVGEQESLAVLKRAVGGRAQVTPPLRIQLGAGA